MYDNYNTFTETQKIAYSKQHNSDFVDATRYPNQIEKMSSKYEHQLNSYLREACKFDGVLPPQEIQPSDCEQGPTNDTLYKKIYGDFETRAFQSSFEATHQDTQEVYIPRIYMGFTMLATPQYILNDHNVATYPFPVAAQIEEQIGLDIHEAKDFVMLKSLEDGIQAGRHHNRNVLMGTEAAADYEANGITHNRFMLTPDDITSIKAYFANKRHKARFALVPEIDYLWLERFDSHDFGDAATWENFKNGINEPSIRGLRIERTIKTDTSRGDTFRGGNIYAFVEPKALGRNYTLRGLKFYMKRDHQYLHIDAQYAFGFVFAVPELALKLELYNGGSSIAELPLNPVNGHPYPTIPAGFPGVGTEYAPSDEIFGSAEEVTFKDYQNFDRQLMRPLIQFT